MASCVYQSFDKPTSAATGGPRLKALRDELARRGIDGFVVPRADQHQGEYVPPSDDRLAWLTSFSGSAGYAVVLADAAAVLVDGRYTLQVRDEIDLDAFTPVALAETSVEAWIEAHLKPGGKLGYDPWLHTVQQTERLAAAVGAAGGELVALTSNPIDAVWAERPAPPSSPVVAQPLEFAGEAASAKIAKVQDALAKARVGALVISDPHNLAWLLNIRGSDVTHTPLVLAYALLPTEGQPTLFVDSTRIDDAVSAHLAGVAAVAAPSSFAAALAAVAAKGAPVRLDAATGAMALKQAIEQGGGKADIGADPITRLKAVKNVVEQQGSRSAHRRDGVAMARFLAWFAREAPGGKLTEIAAVEALESFRRQTNALMDVSFPTIAGAGPHAAMPHYRVTRASDRTIEPGIFLVDSGGQYRDGTTDITRTVSVGEVTDEMRDRFTRVLKGHIAIATAIFPKGTSGAQLDALARLSLWQAGTDFDHGTGHGVGSYLSVHEGPQRLSKLGTVPLEPGMILSNEPGYYKEGAYGIRIENLILVEPREVAGGERPMLGFETLSFTPIDRALIDPSLMTEDEIAWLDAYHADVLAHIGPLVDAETLLWLQETTRPLLS
ncbi:aminopeptidase P family protein [Chelatococcus asaccharovorans]|uniref:Xaa-Pro aminopeptidase n=1 Tax=Chelatococcus asaccharovorans TaxID=28210 RepID=A0A2V3U1V7_9HYPH|nr:aminopeptidase P family protein [Chelatococcus asaccharovorans]MBS7704296.1 aminopeptidase P family protein [Chelatococcus asaccharovorans]PXW55828.1 Xaa-Pro aminopeptidase [Chelatococcus asaccharovorans]